MGLEWRGDELFIGEEAGESVSVRMCRNIDELGYGVKALEVWVRVDEERVVVWWVEGRCCVLGRTVLLAESWSQGRGRDDPGQDVNCAEVAGCWLLVDGSF